jgi:eukaryotic-like serine/threonine-protein kinase
VVQKIAHYNILERLGGGALGEVYRARDTKVGRTVALMQPPPQLLSDAPRRERFVESARLAGTLNHPNIAALFDVVEEDGQCYLAYEFAAGPSLRQEMSGVRFGVRRAVEIAAQIADALAEGHSRGVVHGDLRPDTVVITPKGSAKILNFGMVPWTAGGFARRMAALSPDTLTSDQMSVVGYLSPEQALGGRIDQRSDLFSLGVMVHEMVTGTNPFQAGKASATITNLVRARVPAPSGQNFEVPSELDALLARAMSKDIAARHDSAASLASDLRTVLGLIDMRSGDKGPTTLIPLEEERKTGWIWAAVALGAAAAAGWWWWK